MKQLATLAFFVKHSGWNSFHNSSITQIKALESKGFLEVAWETMQAKFTGMVFV
jgi:hypothetical protein